MQLITIAKISHINRLLKVNRGDYWVGKLFLSYETWFVFKIKCSLICSLKTGNHRVKVMFIVLLNCRMASSVCTVTLATPTDPLVHVIFSFFSVVGFARCSKIHIMADDQLQEAICNYIMINSVLVHAVWLVFSCDLLIDGCLDDNSTPFKFESKPILQFIDF